MLRSLLIIDDDPGYCDSLVELLTPLGYTVQCVGTPEGAVAALRQPPGDGTPPPVALIDVRLDGVGTGISLITQLRHHQPELICVLMTAGIDRETAIEALRCGAYDYFDKRCDPDALFAVLDRCFDRVVLQHERAAAYEALRVAKEGAERANRGKSAFLAMMSHELRTPLNAIIGFSEMILRGVGGRLENEQYRAYIADIHESGSHLLRIINDILDLSKAEAGKLQLQEDVFDVSSTVRSIRELLRARLGEARLSDTLDLPDDLPLLRGDERKTKQVLLNLLSNAIKFTPPGGRIDISACFDRAAGLTITVADSGIGIAPEDVGRVLEPFEQADCMLSRTSVGTGLGLPLVKAMIELHGGSLELRSALGAGTSVAVTFPPERAVVASARDTAAITRRRPIAGARTESRRAALPQ